MKTRRAEIRVREVTDREIERVQQYLPGNYRVGVLDAYTLEVVGEDDHGWTLDQYVIPRLASGLIFAREVK